MNCRITYGDKNQVLYVEAPNGEASNLFQQASQLTETSQDALDLWKAGNSPMYRQEVFEPQTEEYKSFVYSQLNTLQPAQTEVQLVHRGKQYPVNIDTLEYDFQNSKQGTSIVASTQIKKEKVILGRLRLVPYLDGVKVDNVLVQDRKVYNNGKLEQIKGVGTELYKEAIFSLMAQNIPLYSDTMRTPASEGIWNKLKSIGIVRTEGKQYKVTPYPQTVDNNGEPVVGEVLKFIDRTNSTATLTEEEINALRLSMVGTNLQSSQDLYNVIERGFFNNGIFAPTKRSLQNTRLYTETEIQTILNNQQLQDNIKNLYYKLQATDITVDNNIYVNYDFVTSTTFDVNPIGKYTVDNPYINEKEAIELLGGARTIEEFEDKLANSNLEYLKEQYKNPDNNLYEFFSGFNNVPVKEYTDGQLTDKSKNNTLPVLTQTLLEPKNNVLQRRLQILRNSSPNVWETSPVEVKSLLEDLQVQAEQISLDLTGIVEYYDTKPKSEFDRLFSSLNNLLANPTEQNLQDLATSYDEFFGVDNSPARAVVQVPIQHRNKSLIGLSSTLTPYELFTSQGLLPIQKDVWQRTNGNTATVEQTYNIIYETAKVNPSILPREAYGEVVMNKGVFDRSRLNKESNRQEVLDNIRNWVYKKMKTVPTGEAVLDNDMLQKMVLYSQFYSTPLEAPVETPTVSQDINIPQIDNVEYLINGDFVGEFHSKMLREKRRNSRGYRDFYSNFTVTENGITLVNTDPITRAQIEPYLAKDADIRNYLTLKKDSGIAVEEDVVQNFVPDSFMRQYYRNYPQVLKELSVDYQKINSETISAKTKDSFVKVNGQVYEMTASMGENSFYSRIGANNSPFKEYSTTSTVPTLNINPLAYTTNYTMPVVTANNLYNQTQSTEIENQLNC